MNPKPVVRPGGRTIVVLAALVVLASAAMLLMGMDTRFFAPAAMGMNDESVAINHLSVALCVPGQWPTSEADLISLRFELEGRIAEFLFAFPSRSYVVTVKNAVPANARIEIRSLATGLTYSIARNGDVSRERTGFSK